MAAQNMIAQNLLTCPNVPSNTRVSQKPHGERGEHQNSKNRNENGIAD